MVLFFLFSGLSFLKSSSLKSQAISTSIPTPTMMYVPCSAVHSAVHARPYVQMCEYVCCTVACTYKCVCMHVCICVCMHVCICVCICACNSGSKLRHASSQPSGDSPTAAEEEGNDDTASPTTSSRAGGGAQVLSARTYHYMNVCVFVRAREWMYVCMRMCTYV